MHAPFLRGAALAALCATPALLPAQSLFANSYSADTTITVHGIAATSDGGQVITGVHTGPAPGGGLAVIKTDAAGAVQWSELLAPIPVQDVPEVIALANGDLLLLTSTFPARDLVVVRTTALGDTLWARAFDHPIPMMAKNAVELPTGDLMVASYTHQRFYLTRITAAGAFVWSHGYVGGSLPSATLSDQRADIHLTSDGNLIACGALLTNGPLESNDLILKTDLNGTLLWGSFIGGDDEDNFRSVVETADSGFVAIGYHSPVANAPRTMIAVRFDKNGTVVWSRLYPTVETAVCKFIVPSGDGNYVIGGSILNTINGPEGSLFKINDQGDVLWSNAYGPHMMFDDAVRVNAGLALAVQHTIGTTASSQAELMLQDTIGASSCTITPYPLAAVDVILSQSTVVNSVAGLASIPSAITITPLPLLEITECISTGVPPIEPAVVGLYPNPATDHLVLSGLPGDVTRIDLHDAAGRIARSWKAVVILNGLEDLSRGVYTLNVVRKDHAPIPMRVLLQ